MKLLLAAMAALSSSAFATKVVVNSTASAGALPTCSGTEILKVTQNDAWRCDHFSGAENQDEGKCTEKYQKQESVVTGKDLFFQCQPKKAGLRKFNCVTGPQCSPR
mmetsp:Transcript_142712/g.201859  ORF Transcript_142712/g.201859 Transcript_142712/m.201859 type:complete len:106 (-) Transcript_142712:98-415(-)